ncbi:hypothetical protein DXG01_000402 [Tephrocybe rancida]|nr:hypothetical protein DXG01_000402 [Tephrocybe rancida]
MATSIDIDDTDPSVSYKGNWVALGPSIASPNEFDRTTHGVRDPGAQATIKFRGTSIAVFGTIENFLGTAAAAPNSSYVLDNATPALFSGVPTSKGSAFECLYYTSPSNLDPDVEHTLVVTLVSTGGNSFWLDRFAVGRAAATTTSQNPAPAPETTAAATTTTTESGGTGTRVTTPTDTRSSSATSLPSSSLTASPHPPSMSNSLQLDLSTSTTGQATGSTDPLGQSQSTTSINPATSSSSGLSKGTTIGIAVGAVAAIILLGLIGLLLFCLLRRRKSARRASLLSTEQYAPVASRDVGFVVRGGRSTEKPNPYSQQSPSTIALADPPPPMYQEDMPSATPSQ